MEPECNKCEHQQKDIKTMFSTSGKAAYEYTTMCCCVNKLNPVSCPARLEGRGCDLFIPRVTPMIVTELTIGEPK